MEHAVRIDYSPPRFIWVAGPPGVGKKGVSSRLLSRVHAMYIDKDRLQDPFSGDDRESDFYKTHIRSPTYRAMHALATSNLAVGNSVLIDSPNDRLHDPEYAEDLRQRVHDAGGVLKIIFCTAPPEIIRQRLETRGSPRDRAKLEKWDEYVKTDKTFYEPAIEHLTINTTFDPEENLARILEYLERATT